MLLAGERDQVFELTKLHDLYIRTQAQVPFRWEGSGWSRAHWSRTLASAAACPPQVLLEDEHERYVALSGGVCDILGDKSPNV